MMHRKIFSSIFFRLFVVMLVAGVSIHMIMGFFFAYHLRERDHHGLGRMVDSYITYIIRDIEKDHSEKHAIDIAQKNGLQIRYEGQRSGWATDPELPFLKDIMGRLKGHGPVPPPHHKLQNDQKEVFAIESGWLNNRFYILAKQDKKNYILRTGVRPAHHGSRGFFVMLILVTGVLVWAFMRIRTILSPIHDITCGVKKIADGELTYHIPVRGIDELSRLASSFNEMSSTVKKMLQTRTQLLLDVSHELRSPLTRMKVALEFIEDSKVKKSIQEDITELDTMLGEILESERLAAEHGKIKTQETDLNGIIDSVVSVYKKQGPGVKWARCEEKIIFPIDPERMKRVISNLLENACKYSRDSLKPVEINCQRKDNEVIISIKDFGPGIPARELPFIFEPFYRADRSRTRATGGYGLGMSICKRIIEQHKGRIEIESQEGEGTVVSIIISEG